MEFNSIIVPMVHYLDNLNPSTEMTTSDLISIIDIKSEYGFSLDELFAIDEGFRKAALKKGYILDYMKYDNEGQHRLPFDTPWVCRKLP